MRYRYKLDYWVSSWAGIYWNRGLKKFQKTWESYENTNGLTDTLHFRRRRTALRYLRRMWEIAKPGDVIYISCRWLHKGKLREYIEEYTK